MKIREMAESIAASRPEATCPTCSGPVRLSMPDGKSCSFRHTPEPALARWVLLAVEVVEAARLLVHRHTEGRGCSFKLDPLNCGSSERLIEAVRALDAQAGKETTWTPPPSTASTA